MRNWASQFDRTQAERQPGSSVKPFLYLAALEQGYSPTDMISDAPVSMNVDGMDGENVWSPDNYDGEGSGGYVPLFVGLEKSLNRVAARLVMQIGSGPFQDVLARAGAYPANDDRLLLPSAALGHGRDDAGAHGTCGCRARPPDLRPLPIPGCCRSSRR